jgi:hypothetical protein
MADIRITNDELKDPAIDDIINLQRSLQPQPQEAQMEVRTPFYLNPIFYYAVASTIGALAVWAITEPFYSDDDAHIPFISDYLLFGPVAAAIGLSLGVVYGISNRNMKQMLYCGVVGMGVGLLATMLTTFIADIVFGITSTIAVSFMRTPVQEVQPGEFPLKGMSFFIFMCGRALAWSIVSMGAGMGMGIALKSKKLALNGFVGAMIGGLVGGLFFDPISRFLTSADDGALSRAVGTVAVGLFVGLFIGIFENVTKEAWFLMLKGPLTGKQFIIFRNPMLIGSSPKSDIYLFKDPDIAAKHASVIKSGNKYILQDEGSDKGTFVNGRRIDKYVLQTSDTIVIGEAVLRYSEKSKG